MKMEKNINIKKLIWLTFLIMLLSSIIFAAFQIRSASALEPRRRTTVRSLVQSYLFMNQEVQVYTTFTFFLDGSLNVESSIGATFRFVPPKFQPAFAPEVSLWENETHIVQRFFVNGSRTNSKGKTTVYTLDLAVFFDFSVRPDGAKIALQGTTNDTDSEVEYEFENPRSASFSNTTTRYQIGNIYFDWADLEGATLFEFAANKLKVKFAASFNLDPSIVVDTLLSATRYPCQRKTFGALGCYWVFYPYGVSICYKTSTDSGTWSSATTVVTADMPFEGNMFSLFVQNDKIDLAYYTIDYNIYYQRGTLLANGSITWGTTYVAFSGVTYPFTNVFTDVNGYPYVFAGNGTVSKKIYVTKSSANDSSWSTASGFPYELGTGNYAGAGVGLTNGGIYVFFSNVTALYGKYYNGSSWSATETMMTFSFSDQIYRFSAVAVGNTAFVAYNDIDLGRIVLAKKPLGESWNTVTILESAYSGNAATLSGHENTVYVFYFKEPPYFQGVEWKVYDISTGTVGTASDFIDIQMSVDTLTSFCESENNELGVVYTTRLAPKCIKFAKIGVPPPPPPDVTPPPSFIGGESTEKEEKPPANETAAEPSPLPNLGLWGLVGAVGLIAVGGVLTATSSSSTGHSGYRRSSAPKTRYSRPPRPQKTRYAKVKG